MFWNVTVKRLGPMGEEGRRLVFGARPDLATGRRMLAVAMEGGILAIFAGVSAALTPRAGGPVDEPVPDTDRDRGER